MNDKQKTFITAGVGVVSALVVVCTAGAAIATVKAVKGVIDTIIHATDGTVKSIVESVVGSESTGE